MKNLKGVTRELMVVERMAWWNPQVRRILKAAPLVVMFLLLNTRSARAACTFNPAPDPTVDGASNSLRAAIQGANASGQDCLIRLQAGTYTLSIKNTNGQENNAAEGDLDITDSGHTVTIQGQGAKLSIIDGNGVNGIDDRVFQVLGGANAVFRKLTIEGGVANDNGTAGALPGTTESRGGGLLVQNRGQVKLSNVWLNGNQAIGGCCAESQGQGQPGRAAAGGGLFLASGTVDLTDSKMSGNGAVGGGGNSGGGGDYPADRTYRRVAGGGLFLSTGTVDLTDSKMSGNGAVRGGGNSASPATKTYPAVAGGAGGAGAGGGLYVLSGSSRLLRSAVSENSASGGVGGMGGARVVCGTSPSGSTKCDTFTGLPGGPGGQGAGGGLYVVSGNATLIKSEVSGNHATGGSGEIGGYGIDTSGSPGNGGVAQGAGIFVSDGKISLANNTLFANQAKGGSEACTDFGRCGQGGDAIGGGLYIRSGSLSMTGDTVASNQALATSVEKPPQGSSSGGGLANRGAVSLVIDTTLIGNNTQDSGKANKGDDVSGALTSSYSLIAQTAGAAITNDGGNIFDEDPLLDPHGLRWNGGPTQTVALKIGSPAIDIGDNAICAAKPPTGLGGVDQRGFARFRHGDQLCDIGAFEFTNLLVLPRFDGFGPEPVGQPSGSTNFSVSNNQATSVALSASLGGGDPGDFIENDKCGATLAPNARCSISITFKPTTVGERSAVLIVSDNPDRTSPYYVTLIGEGK